MKIKLLNGYIKTTFYEKVPEGIMEYDKIRLEFVQDGEHIIDIFMYPDEALLVATAIMDGWLNSKKEFFPEGKKAECLKEFNKKKTKK
jgi:hypothetical protein